MDSLINLNLYLYTMDLLFKFLVRFETSLLKAKYYNNSFFKIKMATYYPCDLHYLVSTVLLLEAIVVSLLTHSLVIPKLFCWCAFNSQYIHVHGNGSISNQTINSTLNVNTARLHPFFTDMNFSIMLYCWSNNARRTGSMRTKLVLWYHH